jgi:hypothetical protein
MEPGTSCDQAELEAISSAIVSKLASKGFIDIP